MAIDPKTAVTVVKAVADVVSDEEKRIKAIFILLVPLTSVLLIITFLVYILTSPLGTIAKFFLPNELKEVESLTNEYSYEQLIGTEEEDYTSSYGKDYSGITFEDGETEVVYYNQLDSRWADTPYGKTGTIGKSGCGPTSLAMVVATFTGNNVTPVEVSKWSYENGYYCEGAGSYHALIPNGAKYYGLQVTSCTKKEAGKVVDALTDGKLVIAIMGKGHFTKSGHFMVLRGVTEEGKILVADPASRDRSGQEWDFSIIVKEAKGGEGTSFWIISM